jgi:hypothetical protein
MGQAVGTAAKLCIEQGLAPRDVAQRYIKELQRTLTNDDQTIIGIRDINDIMLQFTATATSEKVFENICTSGSLRLIRDYGLALMLETVHLESVMIRMKNRSEKAQKLTYKILKGSHIETFLPEEIIAVKEVAVAANYYDWLKLEINADKGEDGKLYLIFTKNEELELATAASRPLGAITLRMYSPEDCEECNHDSVPVSSNTGYRYQEHRYERDHNILFRELVPEQRVFSPSMALSPYTRPYGMPNIWTGAGDYPHTLTLTAKAPVSADKIAIIFDSFLESDSIYRMPECLVKDFDLTIHCEREVIRRSIRDNDKRYASFDINAAGIEKIEITIKSSWGAEAGIYGVNLF